MASMQTPTGFVVLIVSIITLIVVHDLSRWGTKKSTRLSSRVTEVKTMDFLAYLTEALSGGQATTLLDELMTYYTSFRASEGERGAETVSAVLSRLEPIKGELRSLLIRARDIDRARVLAEKVKTDFRISLSLSWLFASTGAVLVTLSFIDPNTESFLIVFGASILDFCMTLSFIYRAMKNINRMDRDASTRAED